MTTKLGKAIQTVKNYDYETLEGIKYILMFTIVVDLFGIYWWLGLKQLGIFLMVLTIVAMAFIIILQSKLPEPKQNDKKTKGSNGEIPILPEVWSHMDTKIANITPTMSPL